jgi:glycosyltransferase involved in cell wall biosynthesis
MMPLTFYLPAGVIKHIPVQIARRIVAASATSAPQNTSTKQLLVDVSVIYQNDARTGIQRVVRSLLLQLLATPPVGYCVRPVFATRQLGYHYATLDQMKWPEREPESKTTITAKRITVQNGDIFLGLDLAAHLLPRHNKQLLGWKRKGVKVRVMVYDLLPLMHPQWFNTKTTRNFQRWIKFLAVYADSAICISESVRVELTAWLGVKFGLRGDILPASTIVLGADIAASAPSVGLPADSEFLLARLRNTPAVLMVGTLEPRKGYDQTLAAFDLLWDQKSVAPLLIIVGRSGWKTEVLQAALRSHIQLGKNLIWLEDASDEFLSHLYGACKGVLCASHAEGFGLPLVEAVLHGKPILARDISVFRETNVNGISYFNGDTPAGLAIEITNWLEKCNIVPSSQYPISLPTWQLSAKQLIQAIGLHGSVACLTVTEDTLANHLRKTVS